jgi:hypothetical protein
MDGAALDRLTRMLARRVTRRTGIGVLTALGAAALASDDQGSAARRKRKKRKNRCLRLHRTCERGEKPRCCDGLACDRATPDGGAICCQREGTDCTSAEGCCSGSCDFLVGGGTCSPCRGRTCSAGRPCCGEQECRNGYCGGCRDRATSCTSNDQCCFSDCSSGACLSKLGGRCARDVDCRACYLGGQCAGACVDGACAV